MTPIEHTCKHPVTGVPAIPLYQGQTVMGEEMWFCTHCALRLERREDRFFVSAIEREFYKAKEEGRLKEEKKLRKINKRRGSRGE